MNNQEQQFKQPLQLTQLNSRSDAPTHQFKQPLQLTQLNSRSDAPTHQFKQPLQLTQLNSRSGAPTHQFRRPSQQLSDDQSDREYFGKHLIPSYNPSQEPEWPSLQIHQLPSQISKKQGSFRRKIIGLPLWTIIGVIIIIILINLDRGNIFGTANLTQNSKNSVSVKNALTPIPVPTKVRRPTSTLTKPLVAIKPLSGALIGGTEQPFTIMYGQPISRETDGTGIKLKYHGNDPRVSIIQVVISTINTPVVTTVVINAALRKSWDAKTAIPICLEFAPKDIKFVEQQQMQDNNGYVNGLYVRAESDSLKNALPTSYFFDNQKQLVRGGTLGLEYAYVVGSSGTLTDACSISLGYRPVKL